MNFDEISVQNMPKPSKTSGFEPRFTSFYYGPQPFSSSSLRGQDRPFAERIVAFACVEGVLFSGSFCAFEPSFIQIFLLNQAFDTLRGSRNGAQR